MADKTVAKRHHLKEAGKGTRFGKDRQPAPGAKSEGWAKKRKGQELAKAVLELAFKGMNNSTLKKDAAAYFGIPQEDITVEMMLHFRQAEKAIQKADTNAYNAVMSRAFGAPKQAVDVSQTKITVTRKK